MKAVKNLPVKKVVAMIALRHDPETKVFVARRNYGDFDGLFEFPGGKIHLEQHLADGTVIPEENPRDALMREIQEELALEIRVGDLFMTKEYDYPKFHLSMQCYFCEVLGGEMQLRAHSEAKWLNCDELRKLEWCPADIEIARDLIEFEKENA